MTEVALHKSLRNREEDVSIYTNHKEHLTTRNCWHK